MVAIRLHDPIRLFRTLLASVGCLLLMLLTPPAARAQDQSTPPPKPIEQAVPAARAATNVAVISLRGEINATTARSIKRRLDEAAKGGAQAIVIDLDTPGGEVGAVLEICTAIKKCPVTNIVAWVNPNAYSGGAVVALACREIILADSATLGDALPISLSMGMFLNKLSEPERQKVLAPLLAEVVDSARRRGYDEKLVQGMVSLGVELWLVESTERPGELLFIDRNEYRLLFGQEPSSSSPRMISASPTASNAAATGPTGPTEPSGTVPIGPEGTHFIPASPKMGSDLSRNVSSVLASSTARAQLSTADQGKWTLVEYVSDGRGIFTFKNADLYRYRLAVKGPTKDGTINTDEELKAFFGAANLARLDQSGFETAAAFLAHPIVRGVLIVVFLLGLFIEMTHPGTVLPGTVAAAALVVLLAPPLIIGMAAWWVVAAILLGIVLLAMEVFILPGFGVFGVIGLILLFGGLVGTFASTGSQGLFPNTPQGRSDLLYGVVTVLISSSTAVVLMYFVAKNFGSLPVVGRLVLATRHGDASDAGDSDMLAAMDDGSGDLRPGDFGTALTPLRPAGRVQVGERIVDVVAEVGYIPAGAPIRVTSVSAFRVTVDAAAAPGRA